MTPRINEGDLVIVQRKNYADNDDTILCVNDEKVLIKKYKKDGDKIILVSDNQAKYTPFIAKENFSVIGIIRGVLTYN